MNNTTNLRQGTANSDDEHAVEKNFDPEILLLCAALIVLFNSYLMARLKQQNRRKQAISRFLLGNQALADTLIGLVYVPAFVIDTYIQIGIIQYVGCFVFFNSLFSRCILGYDRYLSINRPFQYRRSMSIKSVKRLLLIFLAISCLLTIIPLSWIGASEKTKSSINKCFTSFLCLAILALLLFMLVIYTATFCKTKRFIRSKLSKIKKRPALLSDHSDAMCRSYSRKERRLVAQLAVLAFCFAFTYMPILYINLMGPILHKYDTVLQSLLRASLYTFVVNAALTPLAALLFNIDGTCRTCCC